MTYGRLPGVCLVLTLIVAQSSISESNMPHMKPIFAEFMGVCGHTIQFKPELYAATCRLVRDYHSFSWDVGEETDYWPQFPFARNRVNWDNVYGKWKEAGYDTDVSLMFANTPAERWIDMPRDAFAYGFSFARVFGPSSRRASVVTVEIGNEPGHYDDTTYRTLFENTARGVRMADPAMKIATCAVTVGESGRYAKSVDCFDGLEDLYDIVNIHVYAQVEPWPTWLRSFPEDPNIDYLDVMQDVILWRDEHVPDKPIWLTEFGWDASTKPAPAEGTFSRWVGATDTQQAQYLVRSFLVTSELAIDRAYIFFFNDSDEPQVHGSSGLTRNFEPKTAFHAVAHLYRTLGDYRFSRVLEERVGDLYVYEFVHGQDASHHVWAIWSPTGKERVAQAELPLDGYQYLGATQMPLTAEGVTEVKVTSSDSHLSVEYGESPIFVQLQASQGR